MNATAIRFERDEVTQYTATVTRALATTYVLSTPVGVMSARRAHSCLTPPRVGDTVLLAATTRSNHWVLAILSRADDEGGTAIEVDGDLAVRCRAGRLDLGAREGLSLTTAGELDATAGALRVRAVDGDVALSRLAFVSRYVMSEVEKAKVVAKSFDGVFGRWSQKVKHAYRWVEELDQLHAKQIDYRAEGTASLRTQNTVVTADQLVKIDGGQVHLG